MATYPIKMLRDEDRNSFMPFTAANAVAEASGATMQELMDSGKYKVQNNVTTSSAGKGVLDAYQGKLLNDKFNNYVPNTKIGAANGVASLDGEGKVPTAQLPSYVDDVIEAYTRSGATALSAQWLSLTDGGAALTPEKGKIYLIMSEGDYQNKQYRWGGSTYVLCNPSDVNSVNGFTGVVTLKSLTIQKNGTQVGDTFNGSVNKTINLSIPTKTSDITNNSGFITAADDITGNAATATNATNDGNGNNIVNTYVPKAGNVTITGTKTFSTTGGLVYSGIETASSSSERPVWFAKNNSNGTPVVNASQFTYNPGTDTLKVGNVTGNASSATKLATARKIDGVNFDGSVDIIHYGTCSTAAATADKTVACTGFNLVTGAIIYVRFTVTNSAAVGNLTLNVNGTGAKAIKYRNGNILAAGSLANNRTYCFVYDGTYWQLVGDLDTNDNTYDRIKYSNNITAGGAGLSASNIVVADSNGVYSNLKTGNAFDITKPILYAGSNIDANATGNNNYLAIPFTITTTQSITLTVNKVVYIKGQINGKTFTPVSTTPLTQTEPSSADGYEYLLLGRAYSTTNIYLEPFHPIYAFTGGKFTRINGNEITNLSISGKVITYTRADNSTGTLTTQDTVYTLPIAAAGTLGGVKVGTGLSINATSGVLDVTGDGVTAEHVEWTGVLNRPTNVSAFTNDSAYITLANVMGGATASTAGTAGVVPAPGAGKQANFLRGDGQWAIVDYATSATNDGSGNSITDTYVTKGTEQTITGNKTFNGNLIVGDVNKAKYTVSNTSNIYPSADTLTGAPWNRDLWHDHFAFLKYHTISSQESTTDGGGTWSATTKDIKKLFNQKEHQAVQILNANETAFRFVLQNSAFAYSSVRWFEVAVTYSNPTSNFEILIEHSADMSTWSTCHKSTVTSGNGPYFLYNNYTFSSDGYIRFTFTKKTNLTTGIVKLSCIKAFTTRKGDQGLGMEYEFPYSWDDDANLLPVSNTKTLGSSTLPWANVYATNFNGLATKATGDKNGLDITNYIKGLSISGKVITYTKGDNTTGTITTQDTVYTLPIAGTGSTGTLGGIRVGSGLSIDSGTGVLSATGGGTADSVEWSGVLNKPTNVSYWTNDAGYTTNTGTITGVSVNGTSVATSGVANITSVPASILTGAIPSAVTATTQSQGNNSTKLATTAYVDTAVAGVSGAMMFKGTIGTGGSAGTTLPTTGVKVGDTYKIVTAGTYASQTAKVGDMFIATATTPTWAYIPSGDEGNGTVTSITLQATGPIAIDSTAAITTSGTRTLSHANSGVTAGTYRSVTVNATGHVTAGTNPTTLSGYGITDAKIANGVITLGSNTITPITDISGKVDKAGDTMTGDLTIQKATPRLTIKSTDTTDAIIRFGNSNYTRDCITASNASVNGYNLTIDSGGRTILGSGEAGAALATALGKSQDSETLYLVSDGQIYFDAYAQTIGNRVGFQLTNDGALVPTKADTITNNIGSIGTPTYNWNNMYASNYKFGNSDAIITYNSTDKCIEFIFA